MRHCCLVMGVEVSRMEIEEGEEEDEEWKVRGCDADGFGDLR